MNKFNVHIRQNNDFLLLKELRLNAIHLPDDTLEMYKNEIITAAKS